MIDTINMSNTQDMQLNKRADPLQRIQLRWLLTTAAIFHVVMVGFILWIGNTQWIPGLFTSQGVGTFNIDNIPYIQQIEALTRAIYRQGFTPFFSIPIELHIKIYTLSYVLLSPAFGFSILGAEVVNLFYYLATLFLVYALAKEIFNHPAGMIAASIVGLWPSYVIHTTQLLKTPLFITSTLTVVVATVYCYRRKLSPKIIVMSAGFYLISVLILTSMLENSGRKPLTDAIIAISLLGIIFQKAYQLFPKIKKILTSLLWLVAIAFILMVVLPEYFPGFQRGLYDQLNSVAEELGSARERFITFYPSAGSNMDTHYSIHDLESLIRYLPRAAFVGFLAPFPNMWFEQGNIGVSPRVLSGIETLLMYAVYAIAVIGVWHARRKSAAWYLAIIASISLVTLGAVVVNMGALFRMRYAYWMILITLGAGGFHHIVWPGLRVLGANFSGGVKQIIMSDFSVHSPILLVANWDWVLYNFRLPLARELEANGQNVILVCPPGRYSDQILAAGFKWRPWNLSRRNIYPWRELVSVVELYKIYRDLRPVAVHHFTIKPILYGSLAARFAQITTVINNFTGLGYLFSDARKAVWLRRIVLPVLKRALRGKGFHTAFQNIQDRDHLIRLGIVSEDDTTLIPGSGVNLTDYQPASRQTESENAPVIFMAARLLWDKGLDMFVKAAREIKARGIPARFVLAGAPDAGNLASITEKTLQEWRVEGVVELLGHRSDIPELLQQADIAVLPSFHEGVPLFLLEAAATGLPIVASNIEGCRMVVEEGKNGFLIEKGDAAAFTNALAALLTDPTLRQQMGRASRRIAENRFDQKAIMAQYIHLYRKLNLLHGASAKSLPILLVANWDWVLYNFRLPLARALVEHGLNIILVCPPGKYTEELQVMGFTWQAWNLNRRSIYPWRELGAIIDLYKLYRQLRPAAVHHFTIKPILYGSLAARAAQGTVVINNFTGLGYLFSEAQRAKILRRIVLPVLRRALRGEGFHTAFQNQHDLAHLVSLEVVSKEKTTLIPGTGVNLSDYQPALNGKAADETPIVIMAARLLWDKGLAEFVEAARIIKANNIPARFWLAGAPDKGNPDSVPAQILEEWRAEGIVEVLGHRSDISELLQLADIAVLPSSYNEGVPLFLLEAAATGLPLIASDIEGCRMVIESDLNGFLIPQADASSLAEALTTLLTNADLRQKMGQASRKVAEERFDQQMILTRYIDLYRKMGLVT